MQKTFMNEHIGYRRPKVFYTFKGVRGYGKVGQYVEAADFE